MYFTKTYPKWDLMFSQQWLWRVLHSEYVDMWLYGPKFQRNMLLPCSGWQTRPAVSFEMCIPIYRTTWHHIPQNSNFQLLYRTQWVAIRNCHAAVFKRVLWDGVVVMLQTCNHKESDSLTQDPAILTHTVLLIPSMNIKELYLDWSTTDSFQILPNSLLLTLTATKSEVMDTIIK